MGIYPQASFLNGAKMTHVEVDLETKMLPLDEIDANEGFNCRGRIAPIDVVDLMKSIGEHGLLEPVVVRLYTPEKQAETKKKYGLVAGFRRYKATQLNKATHIRATIHPNMDEAKARVINLQENLKRKDLNILQEAKAIEQFKYMGWTRERTALELDMSMGWVQIRFMVLDMPPEIQQVIAVGLLNHTQIRDVYSLKTNEKRFEMVKAIKERKERGESTAYLTKKNLRSPTTKRERKKLEIFELQAIIRDAVGPNMVTRVLGWCAGEVTDFDMYSDLKEWLENEYGIILNVTYNDGVVSANKVGTVQD